MKICYLNSIVKFVITKAVKIIVRIIILTPKYLKAKNGLMKANKKYACKFKIFKILI
jgi:hypothetical protein